MKFLQQQILLQWMQCSQLPEHLLDLTFELLTPSLGPPSILQNEEAGVAEQNET